MNIKTNVDNYNLKLKEVKNKYIEFEDEYINNNNIHSLNNLVFDIHDYIYFDINSIIFENDINLLLNEINFNMNKIENLENMELDVLSYQKSFINNYIVKSFLIEIDKLFKLTTKIDEKIEELKIK